MSLDSQRGWTRRRLSTLAPQLQDAFLRFAARCFYDLGIWITMTCGYRSNHRQARLYAQGRTRPGRIVTYAKPGQSKHNRRPAEAFDFAFLTEDGTPSWAGPWKRAGGIAEGCGLVWGGRWQQPDRPHCELPETQDLTAS